MLSFLLLVLLIAISVLLLLVILELRSIIHQLAFIDDHRTKMKLSLSLPLRVFRDLADQINRHLDHFYDREKQMRESEQQLQETVAGLSHDIRTPLTSLEGYLQLLEEEEDEEKRAHYFSILKMRTRSLEAILNQLFTYVKLQQPAYELDGEVLDLKELAAHVLFSFYEDFSARDFEVHVDLPEKTFLIKANREALERVLQNIYKNALEHGEETLSLSLQCVSEEYHLLCSNKIPEGLELQDKDLFRHFLKASASRGGSSTGLGLSIAKGLVEKMDGSLNYEVKDSLFNIIMAFKRSDDEKNINY